MSFYVKNSVKVNPITKNEILNNKFRKEPRKDLNPDAGLIMFWNLSKNDPTHADESDILGKGSFGHVFLKKVQGFKLAVKICSKGPCNLRGEINGVNLNHINIVKTYTLLELNSLADLNKHLNYELPLYLRKSPFSIVVMEYAGNKTLQNLIDDLDLDLDTKTRLRIVNQICSAMEYLHSKSVVHLDIKPANIVVSSRYLCKVIDFGCSQRLDESHEHHCRHLDSPVGTVAYTAPEIFRGLKPTTKADIFSLGILMWQLITRDKPYNQVEQHSIIYRVIC